MNDARILLEMLADRIEIRAASQTDPSIKHTLNVTAQAIRGTLAATEPKE